MNSLRDGLLDFARNPSSHYGDVYDACLNGNFKAALKLISDFKLDVNFVFQPDDCTISMLACRKADLTTIRTLVEEFHSNLNYTNQSGINCLKIAIKRNDQRIIDYLQSKLVPGRKTVPLTLESLDTDLNNENDVNAAAYQMNGLTLQAPSNSVPFPMGVHVSTPNPKRSINSELVQFLAADDYEEHPMVADAADVSADSALFHHPAVTGIQYSQSHPAALPAASGMGMGGYGAVGGGNHARSGITTPEIWDDHHGSNAHHNSAHATPQINNISVDAMGHSTAKPWNPVMSNSYSQATSRNHTPGGSTMSLFPGLNSVTSPDILVQDGASKHVNPFGLNSNEQLLRSLNEDSILHDYSGASGQKPRTGSFDDPANSLLGPQNAHPIIGATSRTPILSPNNSSFLLSDTDAFLYGSGQKQQQPLQPGANVFSPSHLMAHSDHSLMGGNSNNSYSSASHHQPIVGGLKYGGLPARPSSTPVYSTPFNGQQQFGGPGGAGGHDFGFGMGGGSNYGAGKLHHSHHSNPQMHSGGGDNYLSFMREPSSHTQQLRTSHSDYSLNASSLTNPYNAAAAHQHSGLLGSGGSSGYSNAGYSAAHNSNLQYDALINRSVHSKSVTDAMAQGGYFSNTGMQQQGHPSMQALYHYNTAARNSNNNSNSLGPSNSHSNVLSGAAATIGSVMRQHNITPNAVKQQRDANNRSPRALSPTPGSSAGNSHLNLTHLEDASVEDIISKGCRDILRDAAEHSLKAVELANALRARVGTEVLGHIRERWGGLLSLLERHPETFLVERIPKNDKVTLVIPGKTLVATQSAASLRSSSSKDTGDEDLDDSQMDDHRGGSRLEERQQKNSLQQKATRCLHVGNVPTTMTETQLTQEFEKYGQIDHLKLVSHRNSNRRFAFITFHTLEQAMNARHCLSKVSPWKSAISYAHRDPSLQGDSMTGAARHHGAHGAGSGAGRPMGMSAMDEHLYELNFPSALGSASAQQHAAAAGSDSAMHPAVPVVLVGYPECPVLRRLCDDTYVPTQPWPMNPAGDHPYCHAIIAQLEQFGGATTVAKLRGFLRSRIAATDNIKSVPLKALLTAYSQYFQIQGNFVSLQPNINSQTVPMEHNH